LFFPSRVCSSARTVANIKHKPRAERLAEMQQAARERTLREKTPRIQFAKELRSLRRRVEKLERKESLRSIRESKFNGSTSPQKSRPRALTKEELDRKWCEENGVRYEDTEAGKLALAKGNQ
jgi:hypothetical protein